VSEDYKICPECGEKKLEYDEETTITGDWDINWVRWYYCHNCENSFDVDDVEISE
jgi:uncharacterized protein YlaI